MWMWADYRRAHLAAGIVYGNSVVINGERGRCVLVFHSMVGAHINRVICGPTERARARYSRPSGQLVNDNGGHSSCILARIELRICVLYSHEKNICDSYIRIRLDGI